MITADVWTEGSWNVFNIFVKETQHNQKPPTMRQSSLQSGFVSLDHWCSILLFLGTLPAILSPLYYPLAHHRQPRVVPTTPIIDDNDHRHYSGQASTTAATASNATSIPSHSSSTAVSSSWTDPSDWLGNDAGYLRPCPQLSHVQHGR